MLCKGYASILTNTQGIVGHAIAGRRVRLGGGTRPEGFMSRPIGIEKWEIDVHDPLESVLLQECCPAMRGRYMKRAQIHGKASIP